MRRDGLHAFVPHFFHISCEAVAPCPEQSPVSHPDQDGDREKKQLIKFTGNEFSERGLAIEDDGHSFFLKTDMAGLIYQYIRTDLLQQPAVGSIFEGLVKDLCRTLYYQDGQGPA